MSRVVILFPLGEYYSQEDGNQRAYMIDESLYEVLGQASKILIHHRVEDKSATNLDADLHVSHACLDGSPGDVGVTYGSAVDLTAEDNDIQTVTGPFGARVFIKLVVKDSGTTSQKFLRMEIAATLILD